MATGALGIERGEGRTTAAGAVARSVDGFCGPGKETAFIGDRES